MSKQDNHNPIREDRPLKKWSVVRSRTVPASATLSQLNSSAGTPRAGEAKQPKKGEPVPAAIHKSPGYFEISDTQLLKR
jgi:hypothetical protein